MTVDCAAVSHKADLALVFDVFRDGAAAILLCRIGTARFSVSLHSAYQ